MTDLVSSGQIMIIGPRASGKTTYLTVLSYLEKLGVQKPVKKIKTYSDWHLREAESILKQGGRLGPTDLHQIFFEGIEIEISSPRLGSISLPFFGKDERFALEGADSAGEYFEYFLTDPNRYNQDSENYIEKCISSIGLLIIIDGLSPSSRDGDYLKSLEALREILSSHSHQKYRIAIVLSKAEQPRIWNSLKDIKGYFRKLFPRSYEFLQEWNNEDDFFIEYFACSAFGLIGNSFSPNTLSDPGSPECATLRDPDSWNPFGLIAPLYWIATGKKNKKLQFPQIKNQNSILTKKSLIIGSGLATLLVFSALALQGLKNLGTAPQKTGICYSITIDEEQQLRSLQEQLINYPESNSKDCQKIFDQLLFSTGVTQATKGHVPVAIDRFCKISPSSNEQLAGAQAFIDKWLEDPQWKTMVRKQLERRKNCSLVSP